MNKKDGGVPQHDRDLRYHRCTMLRVMWLTLLCWALSAPAHLQAESSDYDRALEAALAAHGRGDFATARTSMERAHALSPSARTARGLAIIAHAQGRHVEAVLWCDTALSSDVQALTPALRQSVEELRARSLQGVAQLRVSLTPIDALVQVDGEPPSQRSDGTRLLLPGAHRLRVSAPGFSTHEQALDAWAGAIEQVDVTLDPVAPVASSAPIPPPQVITAEPVVLVSRAGRRGWTTRRRNLSLALGGVGALGGAALMIVAARKFADVDDACGEQPAGACTHAEAERRLDDAHVRTYARTGAGVLAVGGATLITALVLELWTLRASDRVTVALTPQSALLRARF